MTSRKPLRWITASLIAIPLAATVGVQAMSIALSEKAPHTSVELWPENGLASEEIALALFQTKNKETQDQAASAAVAKEWALSAFRSEPLTPEAHALLALAGESAAERDAVLKSADQLDRRNAFLQGILLGKRAADNDFSGVIESLDRILRVRPSQSPELFPVLLGVFAMDGAADDLANVIDGSSPWHLQFLNFAVHQPVALENLAQVYASGDFRDEGLERNLILNLANAGRVEDAKPIYDRLSGSSQEKTDDGRIPWSSQLPPLDWEFADEADFRAQHALKSDDLEIYVRPGNGGVFARRILAAPRGPFTVRALHSITPRNLAEDVELAVRCVGAADFAGSTAFDRERANLRIAELPEDCAFIELILSARSWTGQAPLRGTIRPLELIR